MANNVELLIRVKTDNAQELTRLENTVRQVATAGGNAATQIDSFTASTSNASAGATAFNVTLAQTQQQANATAQAVHGVGDSLTASIVKGELFMEGLRKVKDILKEVTVESALYAARTDTLKVVTDQLAKANGLNVNAVRMQVQGVKDLGITTQEANSTIQKMTFAQLDLSKATQLARVAQDAAVIAGLNSSEALENIITGITTGQTRILHHMGLQVSLLHVEQQERARLGRDLTEHEKRTAMLNAVLAEGTKIYGSYEAAMDTAGKKLTSLSRYVDEAKNAIGKEFQPVLAAGIDFLTETAKWVERNASLLVGLGKAVMVAVTAFAAFKIGAVAGELFLAGEAATALAGGLAAATAAIAANPIGLGLVLIGGAVAVTLKQLSDLKESMAHMFDVDEAGEKKLEAKLKTITELMRQGKASADDFKDAVSDAIDESMKGSKGELLEGATPRLGPKRPGLDDMEFQKFVRERFKQDPEFMRMAVEEGNRAGTAMVRAMQDAFMKEHTFQSAKFNTDIHSLFPGGIKGLPKSKDEQEAAELEHLKEVRKALKEVDELERAQAAGGLEGLRKLNAERQNAIEKMGKTIDLIRRINAAFDVHERNEREGIMEKALHLAPGTLQKITDAKTATERLHEALRSLQVSTLHKEVPSLIDDPNKTFDPTKDMAARNKAFEIELHQRIKADETWIKDNEKLITSFDKVAEAQAAMDASIARSTASRTTKAAQANNRPGMEASTAAFIETLNLELGKKELKAALDVADAKYAKEVANSKSRQDMQAAFYEREQAYALADARYKEQLLDAQSERQLRLLEIEKTKLEEARRVAGSLFDAMTSSDPLASLKNMLTGELKNIGRTVFQNLTVDGLKKAGDVLHLPGTVDATGKPTALGKILQGTPFGPDPARQAQLANTTALTTLTAAVGTLTTAMVANTASRRSGGGGSVAGDGADEGGGDIVQGTIDKISGGGAGVIGGIASTVSSVMSVVGVVTAVGGLVGSLVGLFSSGPSYQEAVNASLQQNKVYGPNEFAPFMQVNPLTGQYYSVDYTKPYGPGQGQVIDHTTDLVGNAVDYNKKGQVSSIVLNTTLTVHALDSQSVLDRSQDIAQAITNEILGANAQLRDGIQRAALS